MIVVGWLQLAIQNPNQPTTTTTDAKAPAAVMVTLLKKKCVAQ